VTAIDVGYGQLHPKLRDDKRVTVLERTNARHLTAEDFDEPFDLVVVDASFISLGKLAPALRNLLRPEGELVALVKPQFEAGKAAVTQGRGVIRDAAVRAGAIDSAVLALEELGFLRIADVESPVHGPKGNVEQLVFARLAAPPGRTHCPTEPTTETRRSPSDK
jgi:23S rRNA (cytidine1920-2'-O)/16S rRNA (cytidine1409-2'-O)-methyltransferase